MLLTSPLSSPLKNPVRDVFSPAGGSPSLTAQVQALFAAGRVGGMWDMGDTSKLFQDSATLTTPVTAPGQTIGLVLDSKSTTVDATVITNGDFSVGTGWTMPAGVSISSGALRCTAASGYVYQNAASMTSGDVYKVTYTVSNYSGGSIKAYVNASAVFSFTVSANGVSTGYIRAGSSNREVGFSLIGFTGDIDDFSVCRVPGNHATQPTAGLRPLYQVDGGYGSAQFDGANDLLQVSGINLSSTDKVLIGLAFKPNTTALTVAMEYSPTAVSNAGAFYVSLNEGGAGKHYFTANNGGGGGLDAVTPSSALPLAYTTLIDYIDLAQLTSTVKHSVRVNGASAGITSVIDGPDVTGNFGNYDLFLGARSGVLYPSNMNLYRAFIRAGAATAGEQLILENWLRESCGV